MGNLQRYTASDLPQLLDRITKNSIGMHDYLDAQDRVSAAWKDRQRWNRMSVINTARSGFFSSDRSIRDYCNKIWGIPH